MYCVYIDEEILIIVIYCWLYNQAPCLYWTGANTHSLFSSTACYGWLSCEIVNVLPK